MLEELTLEGLQERARYGVLDPYTALVLHRLQGSKRVEKEIVITVEHEDAYAARRAEEDALAQKVRAAREARLEECREAVMRAGGPGALRQALWLREVRRQAAAQQQRWAQTGTSNFGSSFTSTTWGGTFFYTTT